MENALLGLCVFLVAQLIGAIWWAATINTKMDFMIISTKGFAEMPLIYSTKIEVSTALATADKNLALALSVADRNIATIQKQLDELRKA